MASTKTGAQGGRRRPTVADVAREAGVSVATAGRALGDYGRVGDALRDQVRAAAARLDYSPNGVARSMRSGGTRTIGFVGVDISNPYFATAMRGICDVARKEGYEAILANSDDRLDIERAAVKVLLEKQIEGIVVAPNAVIDVGHLQRAQELGVPVVLLDRHSGVLDADSVVIDNEAAAREAVSHLLRLGHRRIGMLLCVDPSESPELLRRAGTGRLEVHGAARPSIDRIRGYVAAMDQYGAPTAAELIRYTVVGEAAHLEREAEALLDLPEPPTAVFAADNVATQGLFTAVRGRGLGIPDDISMVGFDDLDWTTLVDPPLTVVAQSPMDMGRIAAERLFARIKGDDSPGERIILPTELIVRSSAAGRDAVHTV
ncbi:LacI family DNA-binding transcriptional regulator [Streptomyces sparsogenes]|uniref:Putative LacI-family transcriptional regulator n=1 Tax=Streptomyces sparsogenes DSM 40356 TaxID=1331668 RepID=A0A1R1SED5_9ACTN|nr:LacI family DNA-binding transcriptional regulator [Streptomyces sparsogenes]OMI36606.1 putative LacI-family transcriptional regulator [Streptomyces sparsogenes DSM 40356]